MKTRPQRNGGFTLVEIALAILVVSFGLMAVLSLFPAGLATNKQAIDDTYAAMFAEEVLNGYKAQAAITPWSELPLIAVRARSSHMWAFTQGQEIHANVGWQLASYRPNALGGAVDFAVRYNLQVNILDPNRAYAILDVLPGEYGSTNNPLRFYTMFLNTKPAT